MGAANANRNLARGLADAVRRATGKLNVGNLRWIAAAAIGIVFITGIAVTWKRFSPALMARPEYRLSEDSLIVTPQPEWIHPTTDVRAEVMRDGGLLNVNLLDPHAAVKIAEAFELHAWVKRVIRVQKRAPASVAVELEYRRPVALVEVVFNNVLSYEPVDSDGIVLPEDLFHHDEKQLEKYLRITCDYSMPTGSIGSPWGDDRITGAAHIAALIQNAWRDWRLYRIEVKPNDDGEKFANFELRTRGNARVLWGHAPGAETSKEADALQKVVWLAEYMRRNGALDGPDGSVELDLRSSSGTEVFQRTADRR